MFERSHVMKDIPPTLRKQGLLRQYREKSGRGLIEVIHAQTGFSKSSASAVLEGLIGDGPVRTKILDELARYGIRITTTVTQRRSNGR